MTFVAPSFCANSDCSSGDKYFIILIFSDKSFVENSATMTASLSKEEADKILSVGISPNFEKLKKSVIDLKFGYKF